MEGVVFIYSYGKKTYFKYIIYEKISKKSIFSLSLNKSGNLFTFIANFRSFVESSFHEIFVMKISSRSMTEMKNKPSKVMKFPYYFLSIFLKLEATYNKRSRVARHCQTRSSARRLAGVRVPQLIFMVTRLMGERRISGVLSEI